MDKCNAIGPRGGQCHRQAQTANGWVMDFCSRHNQMVRDGKVIQCRKCGSPAIPLRPSDLLEWRGNPLASVHNLKGAEEFLVELFGKTQ
jgi:hypothetical protein